MGKFIVIGNESANDSFGIKAYKHKTDVGISINIGFSKDNAVFGVVLKGKAIAFINDRMKEIQENEYFSGNFDSILLMSNSCIGIIEQPNYKAPIQIGEIEPYGRLKYIDGAFNSLLMSPPKKGDPCLNALYMKGKIDQTAHTHPSTRIGFILKGQVTVRIWDSEGENAQVIQEIVLKKGDAWFMEKDTVHSFHTKEEDDMALFAFHPDSDFGPTDEEAPMINRTIIEGVSAKGNNEPAKRRITSQSITSEQRAGF